MLSTSCLTCSRRNFPKLAKLAVRAAPTIVFFYFTNISSLVKSLRELKIKFANFRRVFVHPAHQRSKKKALKTNREIDYFKKKRFTVLSQAGEIPKKETDIQLTGIKTQLARLNAICIQRLHDHMVAKYFLEGSQRSQAKRYNQITKNEQ